jgi:hypothetical protein
VLSRPMFQTACCGLLLSAALACGGDSAAAPSPNSTTQSPGPAGRSLVFADEFDAAGAPDAAKWGYELGYIRNSEKQYYTSADYIDVFVDGLKYFTFRNEGTGSRRCLVGRAEGDRRRAFSPPVSRGLREDLPAEVTRAVAPARVI